MGLFDILPIVSCPENQFVFGFLGRARSLYHPEDFFLRLLVAHFRLHEGIDQFIHDLIDLRELPRDFVLVHL